MTAVRDQGASSNAEVNGLRSGKAWDGTNLTRSFPAAASNYDPEEDGYAFGELTGTFEALNATQQAAADSVFAKIEEYTAIVFEEITETDLVHADIRQAQTTVGSDDPAWSYPPGNPTVPLGAGNGDSWFNTEDNPVVGSNDYNNFIHETCHVLGEKHPHQGSALASEWDALQFTIMSYRSRVGGSLGVFTNAANNYPTTPMLLDIAALQEWYGANTTIRPDGGLVHIDPSTGDITIDDVAWIEPTANVVFCSAPWANDPLDLDLSDYTTDVTADFDDEGWINLGTQLANLGSGNNPPGNMCIPRGHAGFARIIAGSGTDTFQGTGTQTLVLPGARSTYQVAKDGDTYTITDVGVDPAGPKEITDFAFVEFSNVTVPVAQLQYLIKTLQISA